MATLSDYMSGTISLANGSVTVTGTGTLFEVTRFREGDTLQIQNLTAVIASVDSDTELTLAEPWTGLDIVDGPYRARQLGDGSRVSTQAATIIELLGNGVLMNLAELGVEEGKVPVGGPTGEYELVDKGQMGVQDPNGSLGKLAALALVTGASDQYIQGDGSLQAKSGLPVSTATQTALNAKIGTAQVLPAVGAGSAGAIGTYGLMIWQGSTIEVPGQITSGVNLAFTNGAGAQFASPTGSWRLMSGATGNATAPARVSLWLRYA